METNIAEPLRMRIQGSDNNFCCGEMREITIRIEEDHCALVVCALHYLHSMFVYSFFQKPASR